MARNSKVRLVLFANGSRHPRWRALFERLEAARDDIRILRVLPLFLSAGAHVARDIPEQAARARAEHPDLRIEVLPTIGEDPRFAWIVHSCAKEALSQTHGPERIASRRGSARTSLPGEGATSPPPSSRVSAS